MPKIAEQRTSWFMYREDVDRNANLQIEQGWVPLGPPVVLSGLFYQTFVRGELVVTGSPPVTYYKHPDLVH